MRLGGEGEVDSLCPLDHPFAWSLIRIDGAESAMLHAVDAGDIGSMSTGMKVTPRWRTEREGHINDTWLATVNASWSSLEHRERAIGRYRLVAARDIVWCASKAALCKHVATPLPPPAAVRAAAVARPRQRFSLRAGLSCLWRPMVDAFIGRSTSRARCLAARWRARRVIRSPASGSTG